MDFSNGEFSAPNPNAGSSNILGDFLQYKNAKELHDQEFMKNLAEFQSNLRLNELSKSLDIQRNAQNKFENNQANRPKNVIYNPQQPKLDLDRAKLAETVNNNAAKNKITEEGLGIKKEAEDKKLSGEQQFQNRQNLQNEAEGARSTLANNLQDKKSTTATNLETQKETGRINVAKLRGQQLLDSIVARGKEARATKAAPSPNFSGELPSQDLIRRMNDAQQFINTNPQLGKFVKIDPNTKNVSVTQPSMPGYFSAFGSQGPTQEQYQQILDKLYPKRTSINNTQQTPTATHIKVQDSKGNSYMWDTSKGAIPQGYTAVGGGGGGGQPNNEDEEQQ